MIINPWIIIGSILILVGLVLVGVFIWLEVKREKDKTKSIVYPTMIGVGGLLAFIGVILIIVGIIRIKHYKHAMSQVDKRSVLDVLSSKDAFTKLLEIADDTLSI